MAIEIRGAAPLFQVFDMPVSLRFYCEVLGFQVLQCSGELPDVDWALLRLDNVELMLNTQYERNMRPAQPDPERTRCHGDVTLFFGCPDVDAAYRYLVSRGVQVSPPTNRDYGMRQVSLADPDGYVLCFQWPVGTVDTSSTA